MPLWLFAVVWVAAWAACRFVAWRWWRPWWSGVRFRGGAVERAPIIATVVPIVATVVAFAAEAAWRVLS